MQNSVNWRKGLFRAWLFLSLVWTIVVVIFSVLLFRIENLRLNPEFGDLVPVTFEQVILISIVSLLPPLALLILGHSLAWIVKGFMHHSDDEH
jgi:hypothetical protein